MSDEGNRRPRHLERVVWSPHPHVPPDLESWPFTIPAINALVAAGGLEIPLGVTFLIGENGSGKSTLVEALAEIYPRRGASHVQGPDPSAEDSPLPRHLRCVTNRRASPAGFFLRAEAMHGYLAAEDANPHNRRAWGSESLQSRSHGESFLTVLRHQFNEVGVYFLDEPEAALSFQSCLGLVALLDVLREEGSQVIVATHSPLLVSLPGATLFELGDWGIREIENYDDLQLVESWRAFLDAPARYLRHLLDS